MRTYAVGPRCTGYLFRMTSRSSIFHQYFEFKSSFLATLELSRAWLELGSEEHSSKSITSGLSHLNIDHCHSVTDVGICQ
eukprot:scaffold318098_cov18-Prasinocladus_malaysianus.AAC.1